MDGENRPLCTCEKTECLRRYCRCFEARWFCSEECSCQGCRNTEDNEDEVEERVEIITKKKRDAFKPNISGDAAGYAATAGSNLGQRQQTRVHAKGCNCRKSECKKLYCECFKHKVGCSARCQCTGCGNSYGVKGAAETDGKQVDDSGSPDGTSGASSGTCNGTSPVTDEEMSWVTEANMMEDFVPFPDDWSDDLHPHLLDLGDGDLDDMFPEPFGDGGYIQHNFQPQTHLEFAQADESKHNNANPALQGPSNLNHL